MVEPFKWSLTMFFFGLLNGLANGHGNFARLAHAESGVAVLVADNDKRGEAEVLASLDDFRDAIDGNDLILDVRQIRVDVPANRERILELLFRHKRQNFKPASRAAS